MACGMPASWRTDSSATGGGAAAGDSGAIGVTMQPPGVTQDAVIFDEPGRRRGSARETAGTRFGEGPAQRDTANGAALNITALVLHPGKQSVGTGAERSEHRSRSCSPMPTPERRRFDTLPGQFVSPALSR